MRVTSVLALGVAGLLGLLMLGVGTEDGVAPAVGAEATAVPTPVGWSMPLIEALTAARCPELPSPWVLAQLQVDSGRDPATRDATWSPRDGSRRPLDPAHLRVKIGWMCADLRAISGYLSATGKKMDPLDAMLVCDIAGCDRVVASATGVPTAGEAGCAQRCAEQVQRYLDAVHHNLETYGWAGKPARRVGTEVVPSAARTQPPAPGRYPGGPTGCTRPDPTRRDGCLTGATRYALAAAGAAFGGWRDGPVMRSASCWDAHAWNPGSDHPNGEACDLFPTRLGIFATGAELANGWRIACWFRANAASLHVKYVIWHGRYWSPATDDSDGWGTRYDGGGVYDVRSATGGHYDHVHVSFTE